MKKIMIVALMLAVGLSYGYAQKKSFGGTPEPQKETKTEQKTSGDKKSFDTQETKKDNKKADSPKSSTKSTAKLYKGSIASLAGVAQKNYTVTKDEATKLVERGGVLVFVEGNSKKAKLYFLIDQDGSFIGDKLAKYSGNKNIGVKGWKKVINGTNFIIVDFIESMD